jgi:hypothetical protein
MFKRTARIVLVGFAFVMLTGVSSGGCSDGVPSGRHHGSDFDRDDIRADVVRCASKGRPSAVVKVRANTSPRDRKYFVGVEFLDADGDVLDKVEQKLTPQPDSASDEEVSANVTFTMNEPDKAAQVESCKLTHAF